MAEAWSEIAKTRTIDDETIQATLEIQKNGFEHFAQAPSLEHARAQIATSLEPPDKFHFDVTTKRMQVPGIDPQPPVEVFIHTPNILTSDPVIVIYFHGGGLVLGSAMALSYVTQSLAQQSGSIVVNVDYRLLPNEQDPMAPFNDAVTAAKWVLGNKEVVGGTSKSKVGVAGDSAGGQICCCVTHDVKGIDFQILVYPVTDVDCTVPSMKEFDNIPFFNSKDMEKMFELYMHKIHNAKSNPRFNPSANPNLVESPPTLIISAELDPLLDWAVDYERRLREAGVWVRRTEYAGVPHLFFLFTDEFPKASAKAHSEAAEFIKSFGK